MNFVKPWLMDFVSLLFPNLCNACGVSLVKTEWVICTKCLYDLPYTDYHLHAENRVAKQLWGRIQVEAAMAMLYFRKASKVQELIHNLKYNNKTDVGIFLGELLGTRLLLNDCFKQVDLILPVPLHPKKMRKRGYNQSTFIAEGISKKMMIPYSDKQLYRIKSTESQTHKSRYSRYENMMDVFSAASPQTILNKHLLLVDDVLTTGATIEACVNQLLAQGASKVSIATLAFAE